MFALVFIGELAAQQGSRIIGNLAQPLLQRLIFLVDRRLLFLVWSALLSRVALLAGFRLFRSATLRLLALLLFLALLLVLLRRGVLVRSFLRRW